MKESELKVFVDGVSKFFSRLGDPALKIGIPYVKSGNECTGEITGIIGLTGRRKGGICITCPIAMVDQITEKYTGMADNSPEARKDMVGELANTIAGNASDAFGVEFQISVPVVITGKPEGVDLPTKIPVYVIPLLWGEHKAYLVVGIE